MTNHKTNTYKTDLEVALWWQPYLGVRSVMDGALVGAAYSPVFDSHVIQMFYPLGYKERNGSSHVKIARSTAKQILIKLVSWRLIGDRYIMEAIKSANGQICYLPSFSEIFKSFCLNLLAMFDAGNERRTIGFNICSFDWFLTEGNLVRLTLSEGLRNCWELGVTLIDSLLSNIVQGKH